LKQQNKNIEELFKDKLHNLEADPGANAWANIQTGISSNGTGTSATISSGSWASTAIVGLIITTVAIGGYFFFNNEGEKKVKPKEQTTEVSNTTTTEKIQNSTIKETPEVLVPEEVEEKASAPSRSIHAPTRLTKKIEVTGETQLDPVEPITYEKSIDAILAEHQQFLESQTASSSPTEIDQSHADTKTEEQPTQPKLAKEVTATSPSSSTATDQQADLKKEQKRIADQVVFPNVFSPDLDGHNDMFKIIVEKSIPIDNIQVSVLDVHGKVIGAFTGVYDGWDGNLANGSIAPVAWYTYEAIIYVEGKQIPKVGGFYLSR